MDMRLADDRPEHIPTFNECARRLLNAGTAFGCGSYLVGARFQVGPRNLPAANSG
jgi:hypothetical protein